MSFIFDLPIPYGFLRFSHCHSPPTRFTVHFVKGLRLWCFALHLPTRFTVHFVKDFVFGALHYTAFTFQDRLVMHFSIAISISYLILCAFYGNRRTSPAHPFHGSLRQRLCLWCFALHLPTRFTVHFVKDFVFGALHFTAFIFSIACFLNESLR